MGKYEEDQRKRILKCYSIEHDEVSKSPESEKSERLQCTHANHGQGKSLGGFTSRSSKKRGPLMVMER